MNGRCGNCGLRREVYGISRFGGGTYRRAGRYYRGSICAECVEELLGYVPADSGQTQVSRYPVSALRRLAEQFGDKPK